MQNAEYNARAKPLISFNKKYGVAFSSCPVYLIKDREPTDEEVANLLTKESAVATALWNRGVKSEDFDEKKRAQQIKNYMQSRALIPGFICRAINRACH